MKSSVTRFVVVCSLIGSFSIAISYWGGVFTKNSPEVGERPTSIDPLGPVEPESRFVGQAACAECHQSIVDLYQSHPMYRSMSSMKQPGFEETADEVSFTAGANIEYRVERKEDHVRHHEIRRDDQGAVIYDQAVEVNFSIGSGSRGKGYLIERDELLFMSPISWYAGKNIWGLSPGYSEERHPRFDRRVTDTCLNCHAGRMSFRRGEPNRYPSPKFLELSIGCERCHGPGEQHIQFQRSLEDHHRELTSDTSRNGFAANSKSIVTGTDPIVNPAKLEPRKREAVCNSCHLPVEHNYLRYGRTFHDFRPGDEFEEVLTAFVPDSRRHSDHDSSRAVSQVSQMRESQCYLQSKYQMGCTSCHDPHRVPSELEKIDYYRQGCLKCHQNQDCMEPQQVRDDAEKNSCVACHMPKLSAHDVPHTSQTDHRIPRNRSTNSKPVHEHHHDASYTELLVPFDDWDQRLSAIDVNRAWGMMYAAEAEKRSNQQLFHANNAEERLIQAIAARPDDLEALESLASVYLTQRRLPDARRMLEQIVRQDPTNEFGLLQMALVLHEQRDWSQSLQYWDRALQRNPWIALTHVQYGQTLVKAGQIDDAITAARKSLILNPGFLPAHVWLSENLPRLGQVEEGARHRAIVEQLKSKRK